MLLILLQFLVCRMFLVGHGRFLGLYVVYVYWLFLFFFFLLVWLFFTIVICIFYCCCCCFSFFCFCDCYFLHFVSMAMLIYGLIFCFPTCFFVYFFLGCSIGVVGKGNGGMYGEFTHLYIRKFKVLWNFNLTHLLCVTITWCVFV